MPRTRVVLGYSEAGNLAKPHLVYAGLSGGEAESAMAADTASLRFEILEGPGRRKNNPKFKPGSAAVPPALGCGAEILEAHKAAVARIAELEGINAELREKLESQPQSLEVTSDLPPGPGLPLEPGPAADLLPPVEAEVEAAEQAKAAAPRGRGK